MSLGPSPYEFLTVATTPTRGSVTTLVMDALRSAIVTLELKPGEAIDKGAVCDRLGVSRFPVSEALARLQAEGLVDIQPQRGSAVSLIRIADVLEYMLIRKALEAEAVRVVTANVSDRLIEALRQNLTAQHAAAEIDDGRGFHARDLEFHELILGEMRFGKVKAIIESTRANLDRARRLILSPRRLEITLAEHHAVADAIAARDPHASSAAMRAHIDSVMTELISFAHGHPSLFADGESLQHAPSYATFPFG
jgi:DNA-binding GntR family transcriptional regulator